MARTRVERLFFALLPPQRLALQTAAWASETLGDGWQVQRPDRLHVTLAITDDFDRCPFELLDRMLRVGERVEASPFAISLDHMSFSHRSAALRPSHANAGLKMLQKAISEAMAAMDVPVRHGWHFSPHMTLGYRDGRPAQRAVEARQWHVEDFVLIRSLVGQTQHLELGRWPLNAKAAAQYSLF